jgi:hypothetical protein
MPFTKGHRKYGGRKPGSLNRSTLQRALTPPKVYPDALDYLAAVIASEDQAISVELKVRAATALAGFQHSKPATPRAETFIGPIEYAIPTTEAEARAAILTLGARAARHEISIEAHAVLIEGLKVYLADKSAEQGRKLDELEGALRGEGLDEQLYSPH